MIQISEHQLLHLLDYAAREIGNNLSGEAR